MKKEQQTYNAALYCRLSRDDDSSGDSMSISTQKQLLTDFAKDNGFNIFDTYIDDGISGTTFDRPDFNRMLCDIEAGNLNMVLTKDLSRLGRRYTKIGEFIDDYFPKYGVRYIAIADGVDTATDNAQNDFIVPFKNVFNEQFAKETSRKTRQAFQTKAKKGEYLGSMPPYGYIKSQIDKHILLIDEEASPIVLRMFQMAESGIGYNKIANVFRREGMLTPNAYQLSKQGKQLPKNPYNWNLTSVRNILHNEVYLGHIINFRKRKVSYRDEKVVKNPRENWVIVENAHTPIINQKLWDGAHSKLDGRKRETHTGETQLFSGIVKCDTCGYTLSATRFIKARGVRKEFLCCTTYKHKGKDMCSTHYITISDLTEIVLNDINKHAVAVVENKDKILKNITEQSGKNKNAEIRKNQKELATLESRYKQLDGVFMKLYDDKLMGIISESRFIDVSKKYEEELTNVKIKIDKLTEKLKHSEQEKENADHFVEMIQDFTNLKELDKETLNKLIDKIVVGQKQEVNGETVQEIAIYYKFVGRLD